MNEKGKLSLEDIKIGASVPNEVLERVMKESIEKGKNGDPQGMINIALSYKNGTNGYPKDIKKAKNMLQAVVDAKGKWSGIAQLELDDIKKEKKKFLKFW